MRVRPRLLFARARGAKQILMSGGPGLRARNFEGGTKKLFRRSFRAKRAVEPWGREVLVYFSEVNDNYR